MTHIIEEEAGTFGPRQHPHNGYYAGDFSTAPFTSPDARFTFTSTTHPFTQSSPR